MRGAGEVNWRQKKVAMEGWSERVLVGKVMGRLGVDEGDLPERVRRRDQYLPESCPRRALLNCGDPGTAV